MECVFKDDGRIKSVYAKRARGLMARFVVTTRPTTLSELQAFDLEGYAFAPRESDDATLVFNRRCGAANPLLSRVLVAGCGLSAVAGAWQCGRGGGGEQAETSGGQGRRQEESQEEEMNSLHPRHTR